jgi:RNA polymerase sigma factor (sigma-70 family)
MQGVVVEASALQTSSPIRARRSLPTPLLRLRSDEQLVTLFRNGHDEAFRVIHDRYHQRLFAYTRQMLPRHMDAEDALQDVFVRVYSSLRRDHRGVTLRPWLYRAAHNRCIDELRRQPPPPDVMTLMRSPTQDPVAQAEQRDSLRRVLEDVSRLPPQQRSALLLRELGGAQYVDIGLALDVTVPAVKSLLVRARIALATSAEARDTACSTIREELALAYDSGARPTATAKAHMRDCPGCRDFRDELRGTSRQVAGLVPALGPLGLLANALGFGGAGSGAGAAGGTAVAVGGGGAFASVGALAAGHVATLIAVGVVATGGAIELQNTFVASSHASPSTSTPAVISNPSPSAPIAPPAKTAAPLAVSAPVFPQPLATNPTAATPVAVGPLAPAPVPATGSAAPPTVSRATPIPSPVRQPAITGIDAVSGVVTSAIGHPSITGTAAVSATKPAAANHGGGSGGSANGSSSSDPSGSTDGSDGTATSSGDASQSDGSQSGAPSSPQDTSSGSSAGSSQPAGSSSSTGSSTWGTTSVAAVSN